MAEKKAIIKPGDPRQANGRGDTADKSHPGPKALTGYPAHQPDSHPEQEAPTGHTVPGHGLFPGHPHSHLQGGGHGVTHPHGHPRGAGRGTGGPGVMSERFGRMPLTDPGLFTIKRLESRSSPTDSPSPPIRTGIHCFVYVEGGETLVTIGTDTILFTPGECAVIPAGQVFSVRYWRECTGYMGGFHTDFLGADCSGRSVMRTFPVLRKWGGHKVRFDGEQAPFVINILRRLLAENSSTGNGDVLRTYLTALMVEIEQARASAEPGEPDTDNKLCNDLIDNVFGNPTAAHSPADHAARLNVSPSHLTRTVKSLTGKTPAMWIVEAVILEAKVLLEHTDLPMGEISARVGHSDPSYFTRMFRKHVGMAPASYRQCAKNPKK